MTIKTGSGDGNVRITVARDDDEVTMAGGRDALATALSAASAAPEKAAAWDAVEEMARVTQRAEEVADLYRSVLARPELPAALVVELGQRAVGFHDEWLEDLDAVIEILRRVLEADPTLDWAFDRISLHLTVLARWDELLGFYDRAIDSTRSQQRRLVLLEEAAHLAKDCAGQTERALRYLEQLFEVNPSDSQVASSLERLLKQQKRFRDLIDFWMARVEVLPPVEAIAVREQIAICWLQDLKDPNGALATIETLLADPQAAPSACGLLEKILGSTTTDAGVRRKALGLLRSYYDATNRWLDLVRALRNALDFAEPGERVAIHAEIARRLVEHDRTDDAIEHLASLVVLDAATWEAAVLDKLLAGTFDGKVAGCQPKLTAEKGRALLHRAAELAAGSLADPIRAIKLYARLIEDQADDARAIEALAALYEARGASRDLLELRKHELSLAQSAERRVELRLGIAELLGILEEEDERVATLRENLREVPGHQLSIEALVEVLEDGLRYDDMAEVLREQAEKIEELGRKPQAAVLWSRAAVVYEERLHDLPRSVQCHERVVAVSPTSESLDALARIHGRLGDHGTAVRWLEQRLDLTQPGHRTDATVRLVRAHMQGGRHDEALARLEHGIEEDPASLDLRILEAELHRTAGSWEALAEALQGAAPLATPEERLEFLREAADVLRHKLRTPDRAVPVLEQAVELAPEDRSMRIALADALRAAGRVAEARTMAEELIADYGRRRPPERATLHLLLAEILEAQGNRAEAIQQLESASSMDMGNLAVQRMLGDLYQQAGQFDRAERAYQALLLLLRRHRGPAAERPVGIALTLLNLHRVAARLGATERAAENLESAFDVASRDEGEAKAFERSLRDSGETNLLLRALELRYKASEDPRVRGEILVEMATAYVRIGRAADALDTWLRAISDQPLSAELHESVRSLALRSKLTQRYADHVETLAEQALAREDSAVAAGLLLRLGAVYEQDLRQLDRAASVYKRAEETGEQLVSVWKALARIAAARKDRTAQLDALRRLVDAGRDALDAEDRIEALFTLSDLEFSNKNLAAGLLTLTDVVESSPQHDRAAEILRKGLAIEPHNAEALTLFEKIARASGREDVLLDALVRIAFTARADQKLLQEAASLAQKLESTNDFLNLLQRAVEIAEASGSLAPSLWAMRRLAEWNRDAGDAATSLDWMTRAADVADKTEAHELRLEIARLAAGPANDLELAASTYERLLEGDVTDSDLWKPLLDVVRRLGDEPRLVRLLDSAAEAVFDPSERATLRLERVRLLLGSGGKTEEAIAALRKILEEEPDHAGAAAQLCDLLEQTGERDELVAILWRQLESARDRNDTEAGVALATRLGGLLADARRQEATDTYRSVLQWVPDNAVVLRALLALLRDPEDNAERADLSERLLQHESGPDAVSRALELAKLRGTLGDNAGIERAINRAFELDPKHTEVRRELARFAERLEREAEEQPGGGMDQLLQAAAILRDKLGDSAAAVSPLTKAHSLRPTNRSLLDALCNALAASGQQRDAVSAATEAIDATPESATADVIELVRLRARLWTSCGEFDSAVADLDRALTLGGEAALPELREALEHAREDAARRSDFDSERKATLRLPDILTRLGSPEDARAILADWVARVPEDREPRQALLALDVSAGNWDAVADHYRQLLEMAEGPEQIKAALQLADACDKAGRPEDAREGLERVYQADPGSTNVRARLRKLYEQTAAYRELANLLLIDARYASDDNQKFELQRDAGRIRLLDMKQPNAAIGPLSEALELRPNDHDTTLMLADSYTAAGLVDEAAQMLDAAINRHGGKRSRELAALQHRMARVAALGDRENELSWLYAAFDSYPQSGEIASELSDLAMELGHFEVALKALRAITTMKNPGPMSRPMAYLKQAHIAHQQGDERKAVFFAKKAQAEDPEFVEAREFLQILGQPG